MTAPLTRTVAPAAISASVIVAPVEALVMTASLASVTTTLPTDERHTVTNEILRTFDPAADPSESDPSSTEPPG